MAKTDANAATTLFLLAIITPALGIAKYVIQTTSSLQWLANVLELLMVLIVPLTYMLRCVKPVRKKISDLCTRTRLLSRHFYPPQPVNLLPTLSDESRVYASTTPYELHRPGDLTHRRPAVYGSTPPASRVTSLSASTASQDEIENANGFPASTNHTHSPDIYRCNDCTQDFSQAKLLKQHRRIEHVQGPNHCETHKRYFDDSYSLYQHYASQGDHNWCFSCAIDFPDNQELNEHCTNDPAHQASSAWLCPRCSGALRDPVQIRSHIFNGCVNDLVPRSSGVDA